MRYLCLVYIPQEAMDALSKSEQAELDRKCLAYDEELRRTGHHIASDALAPISGATTVRALGGRVSVTDGPFAETKEQLAGFILIEARDLNEAARLIANCPITELASIEVRPILGIAERPFAQFAP
jgi:hypothetical protein